MRGVIRDPFICFVLCECSRRATWFEQAVRTPAVNEDPLTLLNVGLLRGGATWLEQVMHTPAASPGPFTSFLIQVTAKVGHLVGAGDAHAGGDQRVRLQQRHQLAVLPPQVPLQLLRGQGSRFSGNRDSANGVA